MTIATSKNTVMSNVTNPSDQPVTSNPPNMSDQRQSPLLGRPRELRDMIYKQVFKGCVLRLERRKKASPESIGLLLTCKQLSVEAIDVYYRNVVIEVDRFFADLDIWVCQVPLRYLKQIPKIKLVLIESSCGVFEAPWEDKTALAIMVQKDFSMDLGDTHSVQVSRQLSVEYKNSKTGQM